MGKKHRVKYRIIQETLMRDLVEFIDEIQFDAAKIDTPENHHLINLCNYLISCLINADGFTEDFGKDDDEDNIHDIPDDAIKWDSTPTDSVEFEFKYLSDDDYEKMMSEASKIFNKYNDKYRGKTKRVNGKSKISLEKFKRELLADNDLTPEEKFELYYDEYDKRKKKKGSLDSILFELGIKKSNKK
mgnify:CR=1 FL=1|tara:strand:+ start:563 stop:1123 length:561 start_codon:yes stop_codon:yes gene_type:complete